MKEYINLSKEELIEELKRKDEQITDLKEKYNCLKADTTKEFDKLKQENEKFKRSYYNSELSGLKAENELFKNTIIAMATYAYPGIADFDKIFRNINYNLEMIRKGK